MPGPMIRFALSVTCRVSGGRWRGSPDPGGADVRYSRNPEETSRSPGTSGPTGLPGTAFQVTRGVSATRNVWPGGNVIVSGSALSPNHEDPIRVGDRQLGTAITDAFGDFQVGVTMPFDATSGRTRFTVVDPAGNFLALINVLVSWPQERHDEGGTGDDLLEQALNTSNAPSLTQHWAKFCCASTGVAVAGGLAFVGYVIPQQWDNLVGVEAYRVGTGALAWDHLVSADNG